MTPKVSTNTETGRVAAHKHRGSQPGTPLALVRRARRIHRALAAEYPEAHCELTHRNPFELLVATVLSAQTTDVRVNQVTPALFAAYPDPPSLAGADPDHVAELIRPTGFYKAKTRSITRLAHDLVHRFGSEVPKTLEELVSLPGVGRKTAHVVLGNAFGVPGLTIDTHFGRLARRFGWSDAQRPEQVEHDVAGLFDRKDYTELSHRIIFHGRRTCHARRPACGVCIVGHDCPSFGVGETDPVLAQKLMKPATAAQRAAAHQTAATRQGQ